MRIHPWAYAPGLMRRRIKRHQPHCLSFRLAPCSLRRNPKKSSVAFFPINFQYSILYPRFSILASQPWARFALCAMLFPSRLTFFATPCAQNAFENLDYLEPELMIGICF